MTKINPKLLSRLEYKLGVERSQVYRRIRVLANDAYLPRHLAALLLASQVGINITKFASDEEMTALRQAQKGTTTITRDVASVEKKPSTKKKQTQPLTFVGVRIDDPFISTKDIDTAKRNAELYPIIYAFENSVRRFIKTTMTNEFGDKWWDDKVNEPTKRKIEIRRNAEKGFPWHSNRSADPIYYTDIDDLLSIMKRYSKEFRLVLKKKYDRVLVWFEDIERTRHILAHNNPVAKKDRNRFLQYAQDWMDLSKEIFDDLVT